MPLKCQDTIVLGQLFILEELILKCGNVPPPHQPAENTFHCCSTAAEATNAQFHGERPRTSFCCSGRFFCNRTTNVEGRGEWQQPGNITTLYMCSLLLKGHPELITAVYTRSDCCRRLLLLLKMFETPRSTNEEAAHSVCPSPPRPNANFANISMSAALALPSSAHLNSSPRPRPSLSRVSSATSTFSSLSSDSPQSLTLTLDDEISSSNGHPGFFLAAPATRRTSSYYPTPRRRGGNSSSATAPHQGNSSSIIELRPRRSSIRFKLQPRRSSEC